MASTIDDNKSPGLTQSAAVSAVFDTYELLENIILALPFQDILLTPAVSQTWRTIFATSPAINKRLRSTNLEKPFPGRLIPYNYVITIQRNKADYVLRRLNEIEIIIILKHHLWHEPRSRLVVIDGKINTLKITRHCPIYLDVPPFQSSWHLEVRMGDERWICTVREWDLPSEGHKYLNYYYADGGSGKAWLL